MAQDIVKNPQDIKDLILTEESKKQFAAALPKHLSADRFIRIAITAMTRTPKLMQCTKQSLLSCLLDLSQLGIEPDGRRAHLIPFFSKKLNATICTLIVDYKGLVELVVNTGQVSNVHADVVCDNDEFIYNKGSIEKHTINFRKSRGVMYAAYCIITFKDGTAKTEVMSKEDVDSIRGRSKTSDSGPWVTDYNEMSKKTVFRRAAKWVKLSPEQRDVIEKDDHHQFDPIEVSGKPVVEMPKEITPAEPKTDDISETPEMNLKAAEIADSYKHSKTLEELEKTHNQYKEEIDTKMSKGFKEWLLNEHKSANERIRSAK